MSIKEKAAEISKNLQELVENETSEIEIEVKIQLTAEQNTIYQLIKVFSKAADNTLTDEEIINMIFRNGLVYELGRIKAVREYIYNMGNLEMLADDNNVGLSEENRKVASAVVAPPKTIDEYWQLGYTTIKCPRCRQRAVWHSGSQDYQCLDGCRKAGIIEGENK